MIKVGDEVVVFLTYKKELVEYYGVVGRIPENGFKTYRVIREDGGTERVHPSRLDLAPQVNSPLWKALE